MNAKFFKFITTNQVGKRKYVACLYFGEEMTEDLINEMIPIYITEEKHYYEKAICIVSDYPFFENYKTFLFQLYKMQQSKFCMIELEKVVSYFIEFCRMEDTPNYSLMYEIGSESIKFSNNYLDFDYIDKKTHLILASCLIPTHFINILISIYLEGKLLFYSSSKYILTDFIISLLELIYPFDWPHILIPILPKNMQQFIDAPVPYIIGVNYALKLDEISDDCIVVDLDQRKIIKNNTNFPIPQPYFTDKFKKKINSIYDKDRNGFIEEFSSIKEDIDFAFVKISSMIDLPTFNPYDIKDLFFEFNLNFFKNFEKSLKLSFKSQTVFQPSKDKNEILNSTSSIYNKFDVLYYLKENNSLNPDSFLYKFCETNVFIMFIDKHVNEIEKNEIEFQISNKIQGDKHFISDKLKFCLDKYKNGKDKNKSFFRQDSFKCNTIVQPIDKYLQNNKSFYEYKKENLLNYPKFPIFDRSKFINSSLGLKNIYQEPHFYFANNEWYYKIESIKSKELAYITFQCILEIWMMFNNKYLQKIDDLIICEKIIEITLFILTEFNKQYKGKFNFSMSILHKTYKILGGKIKKFEILKYVKSKIEDSIKLFDTTIQTHISMAFIEGLNTKSDESDIKKMENGKDNNEIKSSQLITIRKISNFNRKNSLQQNNINEINTNNVNFKKLVNNNENKANEKMLLDNINLYISAIESGFITYDFCRKCLEDTYKYIDSNSGKSFFKLKHLEIEEVICQFKRNINLNSAICKTCHSDYKPNLYVLLNSSKNLDDLLYLKLSSPFYLIKEIENHDYNGGDLMTSIYDKNSKLFWNIIFYFRLFGFPLYVIDNNTNIIKLQKSYEDLINIFQKNIIKGWNKNIKDLSRYDIITSETSKDSHSYLAIQTLKLLKNNENNKYQNKLKQENDNFENQTSSTLNNSTNSKNTLNTNVNKDSVNYENLYLELEKILHCNIIKNIYNTPQELEKSSFLDSFYNDYYNEFTKLLENSSRFFYLENKSNIEKIFDSYITTGDYMTSLINLYVN